MSEELLGRILTAIAESEAKLGARSDRLEAAQNRLRTDLITPTERVLNDQAALRDDMNVVMARLDRLDATVQTGVAEMRALHRQFGRRASRVTALESRNGQ